MKKLDGKIFLIYSIVILYIVLSSTFLVNTFKSDYTYYINPICWFIIFLINLYVTKDDKTRFKGKTDKVQVIFITILGYLILYFISGLFFGYQKTPFASTILAYIKNFIAFFVVLIFREFTRSVFVNNCGKKFFLYFLTTVIFILLEINFTTLFTTFNDPIELFKYTCSTLLPLIAKNILLTYLVIMAGCQGSLAYTLPLAFAKVILPIFPALDWFMTSIFELLLTLITFISVYHVHEEKTLREPKRRLKKDSPFKIILILIVLLVFVGFVGGFFKYMPVAVMSNSMYDTFERGDAVIVSKIKEEEVYNLKIGDIVEYTLDHAIVMHRIADIRIINNETYFVTKGDNNNAPDEKLVSVKQVIGTIKYRVPKVGYPAVLLNEFFKRQKPAVET